MSSPKEEMSTSGTVAIFSSSSCSSSTSGDMGEVSHQLPTEKTPGGTTITFFFANSPTSSDTDFVKTDTEPVDYRRLSTTTPDKRQPGPGTEPAEGPLFADLALTHDHPGRRCQLRERHRAT